jgi:hypothetical protein
MTSRAMHNLIDHHNLSIDVIMKADEDDIRDWI